MKLFIRSLFFRIKGILIKIKILKNFSFFLLDSEELVSFDNNHKIQSLVFQSRVINNFRDQVLKLNVNDVLAEGVLILKEVKLYHLNSIIVQSNHGIITYKENVFLEPFHSDVKQYMRFSSFFGCYVDNTLLKYYKPSKIVTLKSALVISTPAANRNYYHFMLDMVPKLFMDRNDIDYFDWIIVNGPLKDYAFELLEAIGLQNKTIVMTNKIAYYVKEAKVIGHIHVNGYPSEQAISIARRSLLSTFKVKNKGINRLYISRRDSKNRKMLNENELELALTERGYTIVLLSELSLSTQISLFSQSEKIIAAHGAGLSNLVFCKERTSVLEIFNDKHIAPFFHSICSVLNLNYRSIVFKANSRGDFSVDIDRIVSMDTA